MTSPSRVLFAVSLLAACGDPPVTSASASAEDSASESAPSTASTNEPETTTPTTTGSPTAGSATDGMTSDGTTSPVTTTAESSTGPQTTVDTSTTTQDTTSTGTTAPVDTGDDTTSTGDDTDTSGSSSTTSDDTTTGSAVCECPDLEVPLDDGIFVLSGDAELWKFFPETNQFEMLGSLSCGMANTFSMAVDRLGFAWVQFTGGDLRKVNVGDLTQCDDPGFNPGQLGVGNFGMAFVSNSAIDPCDRIYGNTYDGLGPFSEFPNAGDFVGIDPESLILGKLGKTNFNGAEVTGTGDGRAFVFGGANPAKLVQLDKTNGSVQESMALDGLEINNGAFAFAFFAGDFYFFTDSNNDFVASEVTHLDYDDSDMNGVQDLTQVVANAPLVIVGAGVSTCAPYMPQ